MYDDQTKPSMKKAATFRGRFSCQFCGRSYNQQTNLTHHLRKHTGQRPFKCTLCDKAFSRKFVLDRHYLVHSAEKPFICSFCGKGFRQKHDFMVHQVVQHKMQKNNDWMWCLSGLAARGEIILERFKWTGDLLPMSNWSPNRALNAICNPKYNVPDQYAGIKLSIKMGVSTASTEKTSHF
jgi:hypothetical protein